MMSDYSEHSQSQLALTKDNLFGIKKGKGEDTLPKAEPHWFYFESKIWEPFTQIDSDRLEDAYQSSEKDIVQTDGGRYDAHIKKRFKKTVYWESEHLPIRRCCWFYRCEHSNLYVPYTEDQSDALEQLYEKSFRTDSWQQTMVVSKQESVIIHSPITMVHYKTSFHPDEWGTLPIHEQVRQQMVKRGRGKFIILKKDENAKIDHVIFVVHGIGSICDMKFRNLYQCLQDVRNIGQHLTATHFKEYNDANEIGRVEFLPISWHNILHDKKVEKIFEDITLPSISKLRNFVNNTLMDILFYTSPVYCQNIIREIVSQININYELFLSRNLGFTGGVSVLGHSLGSIILFDLLSHQVTHGISLNTLFPKIENLCVSPSLEEIFESLEMEEHIELFKKENVDNKSMFLCTDKDFKSLGLPLGPRKKLLSYIKETKNHLCENRTSNTVLNNATLGTSVGIAGTGQTPINYLKLMFKPSILFSVGSPIAVFLAIRGFDRIDQSFRLPTCPRLINIFHPFDPIAYRLETLICPGSTEPPQIIPHHKGGKRIHLELLEGLNKVSSGLKRTIRDIVQSTFQSINLRIQMMAKDEIKEVIKEDPEEIEDAFLKQQKKQKVFGMLNQGDRIDHALQEGPLETLNEYIFALSSHACYWESEDTVLLILSEVYKSQGIYIQKKDSEDNLVTYDSI